MTTTISKITGAVSETAPKYPCINRIGVFGSYARGDNDGSSDVDLLYDYNYNEPNSTQQFLSFVEDFADKMNPLEVDFVFIENLLNSEDKGLKKNVLNDVVWVYRAIEE